MYRIGFDIGGSKIECCVLDPNGHTLYRERLPTLSVYYELNTLYKAALQHVDDEFSVGICMPGSLSKSTGLLKNCSIASINNTDFASRVTRTLGVTARFANDSQCFALAEAQLGSGRGYNTVLGIILGTGVGSGIVRGGILQSGLHGISGEWGHTDLDSQNDIMCRCGRTGCVETWLSGSGVAKWGNKVLGTPGLLPEILLEHPTVREIYTQKFGRAIANMIQIVDPDCIVLGGGLSVTDWLYTEGAQSINQHLFNDECSTPVLQSSGGPSAGVIGAALL